MPFHPRNIIIFLDQEFQKYQQQPTMLFEELTLPEDINETLLQAIQQKDADYEVEHGLDEIGYEADDYHDGEPESDLSDLEALEADTEQRDNEVFEPQQPQPSQSSQSSYEISPVERRRLTDISKIKAAYEYMYHTKSGVPRQWSSVRSQHRSVSKDQVYRYKKNLEKGGTTRDKFKQIRDKVYKKFKEAKDRRLVIHDDDLVRWALAANKQLEQPIPGFVGGKTWLFVFKKRFRICSRKITKFVTE